MSFSVRMLAGWSLLLAGCGSSGAGGGPLDAGAGSGGVAGFGGTAAGGQGGTVATGGQGGTAGSSGGAAGGYTVSGQIAFVSAPSGSSTSVILADSAFQPSVPSAVAPGGFKAVDVTGPWSIPGVTAGKYLVLVAYENDGLVLDPDLAVSAGFATIEVTGDLKTADTKVTQALELLGPEGSVAASGLTFAWKPEAGADHYDVVLFNQTGQAAWQAQVPHPSSAPQVSVPYAGSPLPSGVKLQFRVTAVTSSGSPITRSEDLRGVFQLLP